MENPEAKTFGNLIDNKPLLLMEGDQVISSNLLKARITETDLRAKLRQANVTNISKIVVVVFETTGDISVLTNKDDKQVDNWIMGDVAKNESPNNFLL